VLDQGPGNTCGPVERKREAQTGAGLQAGLLNTMGDPRWSSLFLKDCTPWEGPTLGQFAQSCSPCEGLTLQKFVESCLP